MGKLTVVQTNASFLGTGDAWRRVRNMPPLPVAGLLVDPDLNSIVVCRVYIYDIAGAVTIPVGEMKILSMHPARWFPNSAHVLPESISVMISHRFLTTIDEQFHLAALKRPDVILATIFMAHHIAVLVPIHLNLSAAMARVFPHLHPKLVLGALFGMLNKGVVPLGLVPKCRCLPIDAGEMEPVLTRGLCAVPEIVFKTEVRHGAISGPRPKLACSPGHLEPVSNLAFPAALGVGVSHCLAPFVYSQKVSPALEFAGRFH